MKNSIRILLFLYCPLWLIPSASGQGLPTAGPEEVGLSLERLKRISRVMQGYVERRELAGVITMVARRGRVAHFERYGVRDFESKEPLRFDSIFRIYSMTKPITSAAVMMLYEEGLFQLDDPVEKFIPEFSQIKVYENREDGYNLADLKRRITVKDLLLHTSGLNYSFPEDSDFQRLYREINSEKYKGNLEEMVRKLFKLPISHQPREKWQYSTPSTDVLGYLVEVLSGMPFNRFLEQRIFKPLGMKDTGFHVPREKIGRFTALYGPSENDGESLKLIDAPQTSRYAAGPPSYFSGGGGLVSTAADYVRFAQMMLNGGELEGKRLLSRKTIELMTANHLPEEMIPYGFSNKELEYVTRGYGFGLGYAVLIDVAQSETPGSKGTYRWAGAANTDHWIDPKEELIGILLAQFMPNGYYPIDRQFKVLVYQAIDD